MENEKEFYDLVIKFIIGNCLNVSVNNGVL